MPWWLPRVPCEEMSFHNSTAGSASLNGRPFVVAGFVVQSLDRKHPVVEKTRSCFLKIVNLAALMGVLLRCVEEADKESFLPLMGRMRGRAKRER